MSEPAGFSLSDGLDLVGISIGELWTRYISLGGSADEVSLTRMLSGGADICAREHDLVAQALNEAFLDRGHPSFPVAYSPRSDVAPAQQRWPAQEPARSAGLLARQAAESARLRSKAAARRSAELHATAADLMRSSGQLQFARRAETRARAAQRRALVPSAG